MRAADGDGDVVDCGPGKDTVFVESDAPQRDELTSCETVVQIAPEPANDTPGTTNVISGTPGNDTLLGTPAGDSLFGADGDDELFGNEGEDYVDGENEIGRAHV